jgi:hypothetical protein
MFGGGTSGGTGGFDGLVVRGGKQYLAALSMTINSSVAVNILQDEPDHTLPAKLPNYNCYMCSFSNACGYWEDGFWVDPLSPERCWQGVKNEKHCYTLKPADCYACGGDDGAGVQCLQDLHGCYNIGKPDNLRVLDTESDNYGQSLCKDIFFRGTKSYLCAKGGSPYEEEVKQAASAVANLVAGNENSCIPDPALRSCIKGITNRLDLFFCDCDTLKPLPIPIGCTECGGPESWGAICLNMERIKWLANDKGYTYSDLLAAVMFHEMMHWCLGCYFKRPNIEQAAITTICDSHCISQSYPELEDHSGQIPSNYSNSHTKNP